MCCSVASAGPLTFSRRWIKGSSQPRIFLWSISDSSRCTRISDSTPWSASTGAVCSAARRRKSWPKCAVSVTTDANLPGMRRLSTDLRAGPGNPAAGHALYKKHCAMCHRFFDDGNNVGPELTHANRQDRDFLLVSLVDPSAVIRKEYMSYIVQ